MIYQWEAESVQALLTTVNDVLIDQYHLIKKTEIPLAPYIDDYSAFEQCCASVDTLVRSIWRI